MAHLRTNKPKSHELSSKNPSKAMTHLRTNKPKSHAKSHDFRSKNQDLRCKPCNYVAGGKGFWFFGIEYGRQRAMASLTANFRDPKINYFCKKIKLKKSLEISNRWTWKNIENAPGSSKKTLSRNAVGDNRSYVIMNCFVVQCHRMKNLRSPFENQSFLHVCIMIFRKNVLI